MPEAELRTPSTELRLHYLPTLERYHAKVLIKLRCDSPQDTHNSTFLPQGTVQLTWAVVCLVSSPSTQQSRVCGMSERQVCDLLVMRTALVLDHGHA